MLLPLDSPGVDIRPLISAGWEHRTNESFYDAVRVPVSHRIGEENRGWYVAMTLLDHERSNVGGAVAQRRTWSNSSATSGATRGASDRAWRNSTRCVRRSCSTTWRPR